MVWSQRLQLCKNFFIFTQVYYYSTQTQNESCWFLISKMNQYSKILKTRVCYNNTHIDIFISVGCYSSQHWHRLYFFFGTDLVKNTGNFYIWYLKNMIPNIFFYKFHTKVVSVYYPKVIDSSLSCFIWLSTCLNRLSAAFELCFTCLQPRTSSRGRLCVLN